MSSGSDWREREAKFTVDDAFELPDLARAVAGADVSAPIEQQVDDTYYDTDDLRLLRWGCTLRHRKRKGWTVKLPVSRTDRALVRDEITFRGRAGRPPEEAVALVDPYTRGRSLDVIARLHTERTARQVTGASGQVLVEVVDDRVTCRPYDKPGSTFRQLEAELGPDADVTALDAVIDQLTVAGARLDSGAIKVSTALGDHSVGDPDVTVVRLGKHPSARTVIRRALARSAAQLINELPMALVGHDPEGVHQARVATRRLRSDLRTFEPLLDHDWARAMHDDLKPLADKLGAIRDADVLLARLGSTLARHPEIDDAGARRVFDLLDHQRQRDVEALGDHVGGQDTRHLLDALVAGAADPPTTPKAERPATELLPALVRKRWRKLDKAVARLGDDPAPSDLHDVRILTKRTRYAAEAVADAFDSRAGAFAKSLARVQDALGEHNDAIVAGEWLAGHAEQLDPGAAFAAGQLAETIHASNVAYEPDWVAPYGKAARKRNRRWFAPG